ncbi:MAG: chemotaxis-specific protein-glutamate methyltransferase CheB [Acidobacteria bacterium]|nr:chemotaxis-specific protein-glutamate methyltransferase CheB [Acidobacteriota bacterium]
MTKVLVVEDSPVLRELLVHILTSDPEIQVVGTASNGKEALEFLQANRPDVITMDIHMPKMDGLEATRRIMETQPRPIVIVSGSSTLGEATIAFRALEAGALAVVQRPRGMADPHYVASAEQLVQTVKLMSEVKVVRRWPRPGREAAAAVPSAVPPVELKRLPAEVEVICLGASTGGPQVLLTILSGLPKNFPVPLLVVQHMTPGFVQGFVEWLGQSSGFSVQVAAPGEYLRPGRAYVAPDGFHMGVDRTRRIVLSEHEPENGLRPSVSYLFRSVANVYGERAVGVLLTGMGRDGAEELKLMKEKGAVTIGQDEESSVVYGMPAEAVRLEAATYVLSFHRIATALAQLVVKKASPGAEST